MASPPDLDGMLARLRAIGQSRPLGEALLDQTLVAGIGNMWKAEALFAAEVKPWVALRDVEDERLRSLLERTAALIQAPGRLRERYVYRRAGRPCVRCGSRIRSWPQGDDARMAYWCPACQEGTEPRGA
jgi:endonuclease-8